jgi:hypothetical protein
MSSSTPPPLLGGPARPVDAAVADYLAAVGHNLAGIPTDERHEILEEVAEHLADVAAELGPDADAAALVARLGTAKAYAAELRAAAGYDAPPRARLGRVADQAARSYAASARVKVEGWPGGTETLAFLRRLRPAWWVLRAWVLAQWLSLGTSGDPTGLIPRVWRNNSFLGFIFFVVLAVASVRIGQRSERLGRSAPWRKLVLIANVVLVLMTFPVADRVEHPRNSVYYGGPADAPSAPGVIVADSNGSATDATNLFAFGPDGHPIDHVRIYDQDGHPVLVQDQDTSECYGGVDQASPLPSATASSLPSNVYPREQVTPQLDADGNPTGVCTTSAGTPGFVVPPLAGVVASPSVSPSLSPSVSAAASPSVSPSSSAKPSHSSSAKAKTSPSKR